MKSDQVRVSKLLTDTVTLLCKNGLVYSQEIKVQGLLGITLDKNEVFLVHINEVIGSNMGLPSCKQSSTMASSEPSRKKNTVASSATKVVDLTRAADTPRPAVQQPFASQPPAGQIAAGRKHRQAVRSVPASMMMQQQQVPGGMQHRFHPRMSVSPLQNTMASQLASNYVAQLQQQVARGMSPMCATPPRRQRPLKRRMQEMMLSQTSTTDDDDEDVVIVGTGHEEPSPSWSSPMRKRPLPSHTSSSPASLQKKRPSSQPPEKKSAVRDSPPPVIEQLGSGDVAGSLELTADDIPSSVEDMIMKIAPTAMATPKKIAPTAVATPKKHICNTSVLPEICTADIKVTNKVEGNSETAVVSSVSAEDADAVADLAQPNRAVVDTTVADNASNAGTISQQISVENTEENTAESRHPFVYTDIACDMDAVGRADAVMSVEAPGLDVVTSTASQADEISEWSCRKWWSCQSRGCLAICTEESELADHYSVMHSSSLDLSIPPTVIVPTDSQPDSDADSQSSANDEEHAVDVNSWPGVPCPFAGCGVCVASLPGLVMHHRHVHGVPLPAEQRRAIEAVYRARRMDADRMSSMPAAAAAASVPDCTSSVVPSGSFVCPFSSCGISCSSRDDLVAHAHLSHEAANIVQPICKQEKDDSASATK